MNGPPGRRSGPSSQERAATESVATDQVIVTRPTPQTQQARTSSLTSRGNVTYLPERCLLDSHRPPTRTQQHDQLRAAALAAQELRRETWDAAWRAIHRQRARDAARAALTGADTTGAPA